MARGGARAEDWGRRRFLRLLAAGAAMPWLAACEAAVHARLLAPEPRPAPAGQVYPSAILLAGRLAGWADTRGGTQIATRGIPDYVPGQPPPPPNAPRLFRDLVILANAGMSPAFYRWAASCLSAAQEPIETGAIISTGRAGKQIARRAWDGRVIRLRFPALDRNDCRTAVLWVEVAVAAARAENPGRAILHSAPAPAWRRCDFRLRIAGLETASAGATAISAFACRRTSRILPAGQIWLAPPGFVPLEVTLPAAATGAFRAWAAAPVPRYGELDYLSPGGAPYFTLHLSGLRPIALSQAPAGRAAVTLAVRGAAMAAR